MKMVASIEMLRVINMKAPKGPIPAGLKVASIQGPKSLKPLPACPVLTIGGFTLWPMSYIDNRVSFNMTMYDHKWHVLHHVEKPGARYIHKITLEDGAGHHEQASATFWGQADHKVTLTLEEICHLICRW